VIEEDRLRVKVLKNILRAQRAEDAGDWRILPIEDLHHLQA
jgi:hypothetical protein